MKKEVKIGLLLALGVIIIAGVSLAFSWQKSRVINDLLPDADNYEGEKMLKKNQRVWINADDTLQRATVSGGKIVPASLFMPTKDFSAGDYVGRYIGKYGKYAHLVQGNNAWKHIYIIHNARIKTLP